MKTVEADILHCACAVSELTVTAGQPWVQDQETSFMYMPAGRHTIIAGFRGKAIELTVEIVPEDATKVLSASMEQLQASQPKQRLFGCIEHAEKDASVWAKKFEARPDGVYLCAEPSKLGADHVNGRIHRSWSPSFLTDADYARARLVSDIYQFPDGVRGSKSNPAKITGCAFCLGTLTNKPAFREMSPVMAREAVDAVVMATSPTPFNPQPFLDFLSQLRLAHWGADTSTEEHETLGELYESLEPLVDEFVEQSLGAEGTTVVSSGPSLPELLESGCALVQAELDRAPSEGVKNTLAEMCGALDKARYLLKAKDQEMNNDTITAGGTSAGAKKGWESRLRLGTHEVKLPLKVELWKRHEKGAHKSSFGGLPFDREEAVVEGVPHKVEVYKSSLSGNHEPGAMTMPRIEDVEKLAKQQHGQNVEVARYTWPRIEDSIPHLPREGEQVTKASTPTTAADILRATWSPQARAAAAEARKAHGQLAAEITGGVYKNTSGGTYGLSHFHHVEHPEPEKAAREFHEFLESSGGQGASRVQPPRFHGSGNSLRVSYRDDDDKNHHVVFDPPKAVRAATPTAANILRASNPISSHAGTDGQPAV